MPFVSSRDRNVEAKSALDEEFVNNKANLAGFAAYQTQIVAPWQALANEPSTFSSKDVAAMYTLRNSTAMLKLTDPNVGIKRVTFTDVAQMRNIIKQGTHYSVQADTTTTTTPSYDFDSLAQWINGPTVAVHPALKNWPADDARFPLTTASFSGAAGTSVTVLNDMMDKAVESIVKKHLILHYARSDFVTYTESQIVMVTGKDDGNMLWIDKIRLYISKVSESTVQPTFEPSPTDTIWTRVRVVVLLPQKNSITDADIFDYPVCYFRTPFSGNPIFSKLIPVDPFSLTSKEDDILNAGVTGSKGQKRFYIAVCDVKKTASETGRKLGWVMNEPLAMCDSGFESIEAFIKNTAISPPAQNDSAQLLSSYKTTLAYKTPNAMPPQLCCKSGSWKLVSAKSTSTKTIELGFCCGTIANDQCKMNTSDFSFTYHNDDTLFKNQTLCSTVLKSLVGASKESSSAFACQLTDQKYKISYVPTLKNPADDAFYISFDILDSFDGYTGAPKTTTTTTTTTTPTSSSSPSSSSSSGPSGSGAKEQVDDDEPELDVVDETDAVVSKKTESTTTVSAGSGSGSGSSSSKKKNTTSNNNHNWSFDIVNYPTSYGAIVIYCLIGIVVIGFIVCAFGWGGSHKKGGASASHVAPVPAYVFAPPPPPSQ